MKKLLLATALIVVSATSAQAHMWRNWQTTTWQMNTPGAYDAPPHMSTEKPLAMNTREDRFRNYDWREWNHLRYGDRRDMAYEDRNTLRDGRANTYDAQRMRGGKYAVDNTNSGYGSYRGQRNQ